VISRGDWYEIDARLIGDEIMVEHSTCAHSIASGDVHTPRVCCGAMTQAHTVAISASDLQRPKGLQIACVTHMAHRVEDMSASPYLLTGSSSKVMLGALYRYVKVADARSDREDTRLSINMSECS
jgi:hypothetical protein